MNNPFGIPDEVFDAVVTSAVERGLRQSMAGGTKRPTPNTAASQKKTIPEEGAKAAKKIYDSYIAVGFNETQAFELLKTVLTANKRIIF